MWRALGRVYRESWSVERHFRLNHLGFGLYRGMGSATKTSSLLKSGSRIVTSRTTRGLGVSPQRLCCTEHQLTLRPRRSVRLHHNQSGGSLIFSIQITPSQSGNGGGVVMLGRSDGVLNPGGIRFGPTDIYSVLDTDEFHSQGIEETLVVGLLVEGGTDEKVVLFIKTRQGVELDEVLVKRVKTAIRLARSARHVPAKILKVSDVPVTLTGKRVEGESCSPWI